ncbi:hypothetical protein QCA50_008337 [Cerrena zonata]|uniref:Ribonuclease H n=1 Tax=Cerrena zonata TaxID=2478898 RepID=A0AAW0GFT1_9APHY
MPKEKSSQSYYAVANGRTSGVYGSWGECEAQVKGFAGASYKKFKSSAEAEAFVSGKTSKPSSSTTQAVAGSSTHRAKPYPPARPKSTKGKQRALEPLSIDRSTWLTVYSDGACKGNGKANSVAGVGVWWGPGDERNLAERCPGSQTNNRAELIVSNALRGNFGVLKHARKAIARVLETAPKSKQPLFIRTDSTYSIKCFKEWLPKWRTNGFKTSTGGDVNNAGIIKYIDALLTERAKLGQKVELDYVKGHAGHEGNEGADALANQGCWQPEEPERDWEALEEQLLAKIQLSRKTALLANQSISTALPRRTSTATEKKTPAYEDLPDGWVVSSSSEGSNTSSLSSISFATTASSSSTGNFWTTLFYRCYIYIPIEPKPHSGKYKYTRGLYAE